MRLDKLIRPCEQEDYQFPDTTDTNTTDKDQIPLECINCILDDILDTPEDIRKSWIKLYEDGAMGLTCRLTGKTYTVTKDFLKKVKWE